MPDSSHLTEEKWNTYSHALGIFLGILGTIILLNKVKTSSQLAPFIIYSTSVVLLFTASTCYHNAKSIIIKRRLRVLDHISIYYLIAGTYTPVCIRILQDSKGLLLLKIVWGIALFGTILKLFFTGKYEKFSLLLYAVMGWLIVFDLEFLKEVISSSGLFYLSLGGCFYTIGIVFYAVKKIPYNHFIWHLFVLAGAVSHWLMIYVLI